MMAGRNGEPDRPGIDNAAAPRDRATATVIITTYNQVHFLADAIDSVLAQTRPADEIVVVDDGSTDNPERVVAKYPDVHLIRQENRGVSSARNVGLRSCTNSHIVFLDADDRLLPIALQAGIALADMRPDCGLVYGGYRMISKDGGRMGPDIFDPISGDAHQAFLRDNPIGVPASALHRRDCLLALNGFDETLRRVEDYDLYLRLAQRYPIASHPTIVAEYRQHSQNRSSDLRKMYLAGRAVLDRHEVRVATDATALAIIKEMRINNQGEFAQRAVWAAAAEWRMHRDFAVAIRNLILVARLSPFAALRVLLRAFYRRIGNRFFGGRLC